jgi:2'-5' RNA ligase
MVAMCGYRCVRTDAAATITRMLFSDLHASPAETLVAELRDYPAWHRGRERYGVWIIPVDQPALLGYIDQAREQLADLLHACPRRQPHLTLYVCGFHQPESVEDDDFSPSQLHRQVELLDRDRGSACSLPLGPPDSFASAAFISVGDPQGRLARWRELLGQASREVRQSPYVPHITLGLYRRKVTAERVRQRLGEIDPPCIPLNVTQLHYVTYEARSQFGPLHSHHGVTLSRPSEIAKTSV